MGCHSRLLSCLSLLLCCVAKKEWLFCIFPPSSKGWHTAGSAPLSPSLPNCLPRAGRRPIQGYSCFHQPRMAPEMLFTIPAPTRNDLSKLLYIHYGGTPFLKTVAQLVYLPPLFSPTYQFFFSSFTYLILFFVVFFFVLCSSAVRNMGDDRPFVCNAAGCGQVRLQYTLLQVCRCESKWLFYH